jgi:hypothetical protein
MMFDNEILEKQDITALGLCSQTMWQHMLERVESAYRENPAPWADTGIACIGSNLEDLPKSFDKDNIAPNPVAHKDRRAHAEKFRRTAWEEYKQLKENQQGEWCPTLRAHRIAAAIPESYWVKLEEDASCSKLFPNPTSKGPRWVLRNKTTKEYVRICIGPEHNEEDYAVHVSNARWLRLDDVLIMRICWSRQSNFREKGNLCRGKWAGHRFDIVMQEGSLAKRDGWKNITAEIVSEARKLRRSVCKYG